VDHAGGELDCGCLHLELDDVIVVRLHKQRKLKCGSALVVRLNLSSCYFTAHTVIAFTLICRWLQQQHQIQLTSSTAAPMLGVSMLISHPDGTCI
jgi:hypothetical protein